jgi:DNA polymerase/3'-5' exonuclease PolX
MKTKFPRAEALAAAKELCDAMKPITERLIVAGSLRRRKAEVGDVEILYIPKFEDRPNTQDFFAGPVKTNLVDEWLVAFLAGGIVAKRLNTLDSEMWGPKNKLAVHRVSGIPIDFFSATEANWFNYLVCRTGGAESNTAIASAAQRKGWKWNPYGAGFTDERGGIVPVTSERDVFDFAGLKYLEPWERF